MTANVVRIASPAKVNLGLEILGRRDDGFHEIRSILAMTDLQDDMILERHDRAVPTVIEGIDGVAQEDNLITKAVRAFVQETGRPQSWRIRVTKRVPAPAGLGSASSNAAATLLALNHAAGCPLDASSLHGIATSIGSDVPFFLHGPCAAVSGTGTALSPLPPPTGTLLIAVPRTTLAAKTARLYGGLIPEDFSDGSRIDVQAAILARRGPVDTSLLGNAFERPLDILVPDVATLRAAMREAGCARVALSGAGPAHYAIFDHEDEAQRAARALEHAYENPLSIVVTRFRESRIAPLSERVEQ